MKKASAGKSIFYRQIFSIAAFEIFFHPLYQFLQKSDKKDFGELEDISTIDSMNDEHFYLTKLKCTATAFNNKSLTQANSSTSLLKEVLRLSAQVSTESNPLLGMYRLIVELFVKFDPQKYRTLKALILSSIEDIHHEEISDVFTLLISHTAEAIRINEKHHNEANEIYDFGIEKEFLTKNGFLGTHHLINFINTLSILGEVESAYMFWDNYKGKIDPEYLEEAEIVCLSSIFCGDRRAMTDEQYKKAFSKIFLFEQNNKFREKRHSIAAGNNRVRIFYDWYAKAEKDDPRIDEKLISFGTELRKFKRFLTALGKENHPNVIHKWIISNLAFIEFVRGMKGYLYQPNAKEGKKILLQKLKETPLVACRWWLEERIRQL